MQKKAVLQISFPWLFAIIVGIFILGLAIYAVTKVVQTSEEVQTAKAGKTFSVLLNPLETGFESGSSVPLEMSVESRIFNKCNNLDEFGNQIIQVEQKSFGKFTKTNIDISFKNKYIFSENFTQNKQFYLFSKPLNMPFKIADLTYLTSSEQKYCFTDFDEDTEKIKDELLDLNQENLVVENCTGNEIQVCFNNQNCDVNINYNLGVVEKNNQNFYFETDALMYAGIFSDKIVYECQTKRLMQRLENLASLYREKSLFLSDKCSQDINPKLISLENSADSFSNSGDIFGIKSIADDLENENKFAGCRLW